jgi:hypothetical protein
LCDAILTPEALASLGITGTQDIFGAYPEQDRYDLLAQHVVNNSGPLPGHYSIARLWNAHRGDFVAILESPAVRECYNELAGTGRNLAGLSRRMVQGLRETRLGLSLQHDVPYVPAGNSDIGGIAQFHNPYGGPR